MVRRRDKGRRRVNPEALPRHLLPKLF